MTGIGPRLREERVRLKLSQSALGAIGGVETNAQGNYENGSRSPKSDYLLRIIAAGVDINYVMTGTRPRDNDGNSISPLPPDPVHSEHFEKVTHQLHRNLHGLIDALYQMALLIELRANDTDDASTKNELETVRTQAQELAQASVRLIFETSKLT